MGIQLDWDNDAETVLRCHFDREWTWDEMDARMAEVKTITDNADREIAAIIDLSEGVHIPGSIFSPNTMNQAKKMLKMGEGDAKRGPIVVVGANSLIRTIYSTMRSMDKEGLSNVSFADTVDEARTLLQSRNHSYAPQQV